MFFPAGKGGYDQFNIYSNWGITADWPGASQAVSATGYIKPTVGNAGSLLFKPAGACTTGTSEPGTWNQTLGGTTADNAGGGTCTWTDIGLFPLVRTVNANAIPIVNGSEFKFVDDGTTGLVTQVPPTVDKGTGALSVDGPVNLTAILFANLGTPANGTFRYCSDCTIANPCAGGGAGAFAKRLNSSWICN